MGGSRQRAVAAGFVLAAIAVLVGVPAVAAVPFTVTRFDDPLPDGCNSNDCSLREAIIAANTAPGADTIALQTGTYRLEIPGTGEDASADGDLNVTDDLTITGQGAAATTIDGNGAATGERVLDLDPTSGGAAPVISISDLTVRGGRGENGAGIQVHFESVVTLNRVVVTDNIAPTFAGGIWVRFDAALTILDSVITANEADSYGPGIQSDQSGALTILRSTISENRSDDGFGNSGGGGLYIQGDSRVTVEDTAIVGNEVNATGGGVNFRNASTGTITNTTISGNRAGLDGGGVYVRNTANLTLASTTITGNHADVDGGDDGSGGGLHRNGEETATLTVRNSIVAGNSDPTSDPDCWGVITSGGHNLFGAISAGCSLTGGSGDLTGTDAAPLDPKLGTLADNGGPTLTHALLPGSPAIDAADAPTSPPTDQRGAPRNDPDIGAYELVRCRRVPVNRVGTDGNDVLTGTGGADGFLAQGGNDRVAALGGKDSACLGRGNDRAAGGGGRDSLLGEAGRDRLNGGGGRDLLICGPGKRETGKGGPGKDRARSCEKGRA